MKNLYILIVLNLLTIDLHAQNFDWAKKAGLWAYDYGYGITTDNLGKVYVTGKYEDFANFSGIILPCQDNHDIFLAKYDSDGTIDWVRTAGGVLGDYGTSIACDGDNYVYIAGEIEGAFKTVVFPGSTVTLESTGLNDIFLAKYDLNGNLQWAKQAGWWHNEKALGVTYDTAGNVYICGFYNDTTIFSTYPNFVFGHGANNDIYIAKYDKDGIFQWVRTAGGFGRDEAKSIKCDADGNIYICGMYENGCVFGSQTLTSPGSYFDSFLAKYAPDGTLQWVRTGGGAFDDVAWSLTIDNSNKIFIAGEFWASAYFGSTQLITSGESDIFVACYDATGTVLWVSKAGGNLIDRARGIGCDGTNLFITGQFGDTASFGGLTLTGTDSSDIFIASLNNTGNFIWATAVAGQVDSVEDLGYESGNSICAEASGFVYVTGSMLNGGVFGNTTLTDYDRTDIFVAKISSPYVNILPVNNTTTIHIYPNPTRGKFQLELNTKYPEDLWKLQKQKGEIIIYNSLGEKIYQSLNQQINKLTLDLSDQKNGTYFIEIKTEDKKTLREKIILQ